MACMTDKQLQELHEDIESGLVMIVDKKHYYAMEAYNKALKDAIKETNRGATMYRFSITHGEV